MCIFGGFSVVEYRFFQRPIAGLFIDSERFLKRYAKLVFSSYKTIALLYKYGS